MAKKKKSNAAQEPVRISELIEAEEELERTKREYGVVEKPHWWVRAGDWIAGRSGKRQKVLVDRRRFCWLALLTGFVGGQRFYTRQYRLGILAILFCWSFVPWVMAIIDIMVALPMKPDENGKILL